MKRLDKLIHLAVEASRATTPLEKMERVYLIRQFLVEEPPGLLHVSIELALFDLEQQIKEEEKEAMRHLGYQFPEDFDRPMEFLTNDE